MYGKYQRICSVSCIHSYIDISVWLFSPEFVSRQLHIMTPCRSMNKTTTGTAYERLTARNLVVVYPDPSGGNDPICRLQCWFLSYLGWNQEARKWFTYVVMTFLNCVVHLFGGLSDFCLLKVGERFTKTGWARTPNMLAIDQETDSEWITSAFTFNLQGSVLSL